VSVKIAMEPDRIPPVVYTAIKNNEMKETVNNFFIAFLLLSSY
jgi:hypothetical protein